MRRPVLRLAALCWATATVFGTSLAPQSQLQPPEAAVLGYGAPSSGVVHPCLESGDPVSGSGHEQYCIDVPAGTEGAKVVLDVSTARPVEVVRVGEQTFVRGPSNTTTRGAILEVKPFQQACEVCDACACVGCGRRCECSCTALCRLRGEATCSHTAGVLAPGRWYVGVDAPAAFTLRATLVSALGLQPGQVYRRTISAAGARQDAAAPLDGAAFSDYFYYDPAPHEAMRLVAELHRTGGSESHVDVYIRFGDWPTSETHDATMRVDGSAAGGRRLGQFALDADRLINERLCVLVVGRGDAWAEYSLVATVAPSARTAAALGVCALVLGVAAVAAARACWGGGGGELDGVKALPGGGGLSVTSRFGSVGANLFG